MLALVIVDTVIVVLLAGLVAGLVRSHTEILKALRSLDSRLRREARDSGPGGSEVSRDDPLSGEAQSLPADEEQATSRTSTGH